MSTDTDDKVQSKFPRSSLRARNKTLMITPADVADYQVKSEKKRAEDLDVHDVFEDSLSEISEIGDQEHFVSSANTEGAVHNAASSLDDELGAGLDALSDDWDSDTGEAKEVETLLPQDSSDFSNPGDDDIFAAPPGASAQVEQLFELSPSADSPAGSIDPIERKTQTIPSALQFLGGQNTAFDGYDGDRRARPYSSAGSSALQSAAQELRDTNHQTSSGGRREYVDWKKMSKLVGFLVSYASDAMGSYTELREGRLLVTNGHNSTDSCLVIADDSVSPMHAIMRIAADGSILILDQLSEQGTRIRRANSGKEESLMGDKSSLCHGDVVIFGECEYHVVVMGAGALKRAE